jgi:hypothetical protein
LPMGPVDIARRARQQSSISHAGPRRAWNPW